MVPAAIRDSFFRSRGLAYEDETKQLFASVSPFLLISTISIMHCILDIWSVGSKLLGTEGRPMYPVLNPTRVQEVFEVKMMAFTTQMQQRQTLILERVTRMVRKGLREVNISTDGLATDLEMYSQTMIGLGTSDEEDEEEGANETRPTKRARSSSSLEQLDAAPKGQPLRKRHMGKECDDGEWP